MSSTLNRTFIRCVAFKLLPISAYPSCLALKAKIRGRFKVTTESRHSIPVAANTIDRNFDVNKPNRVWTADIGYAQTLEGGLYLAVDALAMDYWRRTPQTELLHHSDFI